MNYDHQKYVGNRGDVWKHWVLTQVLLPELKSQKIFRYFETHSGKGYFKTHYDWKSGVGRLAELKEINNPYIDIILSKVSKSQLLGSWAIVRELFSETQIELEICDQSESVIDFVSALNLKNVIAHCRDGFRSVSLWRKSDFVVVDPPYVLNENGVSDWDQTRALMERLEEAQKKYVVWYPIFPRDLHRPLYEVADGARYELLWNLPINIPPKFKSRGCGMIFGSQVPPLSAIQVQELNCLAVLFGGCLKDFSKSDIRSRSDFYLHAPGVDINV